MHQFDLKSKTAIITGGAQGFGLDIAKRFLKSGAKVIIWDIDEKELKNAVNVVNDSNLSYCVVDVSNFKNVKDTVDKIVKSSNVDILINNAGIMACPETRVGNEWESQFAVNHIGHHLLTKELMDSFNENGESRLVSLSSSAHSITKILWDDIHYENGEYNKWTAYGQSKTASSLLAIEFDRKMKNKGVRGFAVHPGGIITPVSYTHLTLPTTPYV